MSEYYETKCIKINYVLHHYKVNYLVKGGSMMEDIGGLNKGKMHEQSACAKKLSSLIFMIINRWMRGMRRRHVPLHRHKLLRIFFTKGHTHIHTYIYTNVQ